MTEFLIIISTFSQALLLTILFEGLACSAIKPLLFRKVKYLKLIVAMLLCNIVTNPLLNLIILFCGFEPFSFGTVLFETAVVAAEAVLYRMMLGERIRKTLLLSAFCNMVSYCLGLLVL